MPKKRKADEAYDSSSANARNEYSMDDDRKEREIFDDLPDHEDDEYDEDEVEAESFGADSEEPSAPAPSPPLPRLGHLSSKISSSQILRRLTEKKVRPSRAVAGLFVSLHKERELQSAPTFVQLM
jgi:hypothetical protein